jgi:germination protein M
VPAFFFHDSGGDGDRPGPFLVAAGRNVLDVEEAVWGVLGGLTPSEQDQGVTTAIPAGTRTYFVRTTEGVVSVDLTARFAEGADAASMRARLAQLVFTITGFDPEIRGVEVWIEGNRLEALPDGTPLDERLTRWAFQDFMPTILIESPMWDGWSPPPLTVRGIAFVPGGSFEMEILDMDGRVTASRTVQTDSLSGWGDFEVTFQASELPPVFMSTLHVRVYQLTPDGSVISERVQPFGLG